MKSKNPVVWFEIYVEDMERAKKFYEHVLQTELMELSMPDMGSDAPVMRMLAFPMQSGGEGAAGALVKMAGFGPGGNSTMVYFDSDDCSIEEGRIEAAGGKVVQPKQSIGEFGFMVLASDSEGNMFGIHSQS
jgi:predicted enzyme related to lactoylglutathione lyase